MKKLHSALALALTLTGTAAFAHDHEKSYKDYKWIGGHGMFYDVNKDKPHEGEGFLGDGFGLGVEAGWKFTPDWALRAEITRLSISGEGSTPATQSDFDGNLAGLDALYFVGDDLAYLFSGIKILNLNESYHMLNAGIGKHWALGERTKLVTELAAYYDFGQGSKDYSVKLGIAYMFGDTSPKPAPAKAMAAAPAAVAPLDSDGDGVIDDDDRCPGTAPGVSVDANGCPMEKDSDNDGVPDKADKCPNTPRGDVVDADGCTRFGEKEVSKVIRVLFDNDSDVVKNPNAPEILELVDFLKRYGKVNAVVEGHASAPGAADYNMDLSERRANAFKSVLINQHGIAASRLSSVGYGETQLIDTSDTEEAHSMNRRIVVKVSEVIKVKLTQ